MTVRVLAVAVTGARSEQGSSTPGQHLRTRYPAAIRTATATARATSTRSNTAGRSRPALQRVRTRRRRPKSRSLQPARCSPDGLPPIGLCPPRDTKHCSITAPEATADYRSSAERGSRHESTYGVRSRWRPPRRSVRTRPTGLRSSPAPHALALETVATMASAIITWPASTNRMSGPVPVAPSDLPCLS